MAAMAAALVLAGCRGGGHAAVAREASSPTPTAVVAVREIEVAAAPGSAALSLATTPSGDFLLSWVEPRERDESALRLARRGAGEPWSEPLTIAEGGRFFVNWADVPHVAALTDGTLFAHWLEKDRAGGRYEYGIRMTRSRDGGRRWDAPFAPYADLTPGEHGFVSLAPAADDRMGVLFLDGRNVERPQGAMSLRFASVGPEGAPEPDLLVDDRVCDCCQTTMARTASGLVAAYRDRTGTEVRDVAVVRFEKGRFSEPVFPGDERWEINGCPVNGPAIDAEGQRVALAWHTMAGGTPRARMAFSTDGGGSWSPPVVIDDRQPLGRVGIALVPAGAVVSWLEETPRGVEIRARRVASDGTPGRSVLVAGSSAARASGFPLLAEAGGEVVLAWRDATEPPRLRTAIVELPR
jgi:hypothetical protein